MTSKGLCDKIFEIDKEPTCDLMEERNADSEMHYDRCI